MNQYELLYIVPTQYTDQEVDEIQVKISGIVEKVGGTVSSSKNLGKIRLAYPIKKVRHGSYVLVYFESKPESIKELNRLLGLSEEMLRHTIVTRVPGFEEREFELTSYVAPLSEEAREQKREAREHKKVKPIAPVAPAPAPAPTPIAPPAPSAETPEESKMTMEELDKKLDAILEDDITENI